MRMATCSILALLGLALPGLAGCAGQPAPKTRAAPDLYASLARPGASVDPAAARDMISIYRRNKGLPLLRLDPALQRVAEAQARKMAAKGGADAGVRRGLGALLRQAGVASVTTAQNVSSGYHTLPEAFSGWRQSKPHNSNMLDPRMRRMGIATAYAPGSKYRVHWALVMTD